MFHTSVQMAHLILPPFDLKIIMATIQHLKILFRERDGKKRESGWRLVVFSNRDE
ncbi:Uncharacterized protein APZ42_020629 [Daphnia magna]|uniref:Uncharacterized protein n=1 Tax=Daphnia magna TaxID=35525 RepID=A0A0P5WRR6_9CRUS|nr:Uncharacterized protein APZ42_020629 [Daphnia magna]